MSRATLSVAMIVKNEEVHLRDCLACVKEIADEIIVVDTGSTDNTVKIAHEAGAKVFFHQWNNDFAEARNVSLSLATKKWVLVLDADERLEEDAQENILALLENPHAGAATLLIRNELEHGHHREARILRVFRNDSSIVYQHRIHEDAKDSVDAYLKRSKKTLVHVDGTLRHLGYARAEAHAKNKKARDAALLELAVEKAPDDFYAWFKLLELARFWNDRALALKTATRVKEKLDSTRTLTFREPHFSGEFIALVAEALFADQPKKALRFLEKWEHAIHPSVAFSLRKAVLYEETGRFDKSRACYFDCLEKHCAFGATHLSRIRPLLGLARLSLATGDVSTASNYVSKALEVNRKDPEALLASVHLEYLRGQDAAVESFCQNYRDRFGDCSELHVALGDAALLTRRSAIAFQSYLSAFQIESKASIALRVSQAALVCGEIEFARDVACAIAREEPHAALGVLLCDLIQGCDSHLDIELELCEAECALKKWVDLLHQNHRAHELDLARAHADALVEFFPWLPTYLEASVRPPTVKAA